MTAEPPGAGHHQRPRLVAGIVAVAFFMQMLDGTIIATSLPAMAADFGTDVVSLDLGFTAHLLAMAVFIPPAGWRSGSARAPSSSAPWRCSRLPARSPPTSSASWPRAPSRGSAGR